MSTATSEIQAVDTLLRVAVVASYLAIQGYIKDSVLFYKIPSKLICVTFRSSLFL